MTGKYAEKVVAVAQRYAHGDRTEDIAKDFGITVASVYQYAYRGGAEQRKRVKRIVNQPPTRSPKLSVIPSLETQKEICKRKVTGELVRDLAKEFGVSRQTIYNWLKKFKQ